MERLYFQPNYPARIDTSDPIGGLARFVVIGMPMPVELCDRGQPGGTAGTVTPTPAGMGYVLPSSAAVTWQKSVSGLDPYIGDSFTICWHGMLRDDTIQQLLTFGSGYGWRLKTSNWGPGQLRIGLEQFWGGSLFSALVSVVDNTLHTIVLRYDGAAVAMDLFFDGAFVATITNLKDGGAIMASPTFSMLGEPSGTKPHVMLTAQVFKGVFTNEQVAIWTDNPWHILEPEEEWAFIPASTGGGTVTLTGAASTQANSSSAAGITQTHLLAGSASSVANSSGTGAISQSHVLAGANAVEQNSSGTGSIVLTGALIAAPSTQANSSATGAISQTHQLVAAAGEQANSSTTGAIGQTHQLGGSPVAQGNASSAGGIAQTHQLAAAAAGQQNLASGGQISQTHILVHAPSIQDNIAAASAVVQTHILAAAASQQANSSASGVIHTSLNGQPSVQNNTSSAGSISITRFLTASNATQENIAGTGATTNGIVTEAALTTGIPTTETIKKPGIPTGTDDWLKTMLEIMNGRRGNAIDPPKFQTLTFSATPTKAECEALYAYVNDVRRSVSSLIARFDT